MARTVKEFRVTLEDKPGSLARLTEALSKGGVNIEALAALTAGGKGDIRIVMDNAAGAKQSLQAAGIPVGGERDVLAVDLEHRPGELAKIARKLADANVNIDAAYVWGDVSGRKRLILGVADLDKAQKTLG